MRAEGSAFGRQLEPVIGASSRPSLGNAAVEVCEGQRFVDFIEQGVESIAHKAVAIDGTGRFGGEVIDDD
jgi:hypothetical protein